MTVIPFADEEASKVINDLVLEVAMKEKLAVFDIYPTVLVQRLLRWTRVNGNGS